MRGENERDPRYEVASASSSVFRIGLLHHSSFVRCLRLQRNLSSLFGEARSVLTDQIRPQGYFCIRAGRVPERDRTAFDDEMIRQLRRLFDARDPADMGDALMMLSDVFGRTAPNDQ